MEVIHSLFWRSRSPSASRPSKLRLKIRGCKVRARYDAEFPQFISIAQHPGRPVVSGVPKSAFRALQARWPNAVPQAPSRCFQPRGFPALVQSAGWIATPCQVLLSHPFAYDLFTWNSFLRCSLASSPDHYQTLTVLRSCRTRACRML